MVGASGKEEACSCGAVVVEYSVWQKQTYINHQQRLHTVEKCVRIPGAFDICDSCGLNAMNHSMVEWVWHQIK